MDIKHLQALVAIADAGSITRAAAQIYITQPTLSTRIASLEDLLGTKLFIRSKQGVLLTDAGEKMYSYAKTILKLADSAVNELTADLDNPRGTVVIGCLDSLCNVVGSRVIRSALDAYPNVNLEFQGGNTPELYKRLLGGSRVDMAILQKDINVLVGDSVEHSESIFVSSTLEYFELFNDELLYCTQRKTGSPVFPDEGISAGDMESTNIVLPVRHHPITQSMEWIVQKSGISLDRIVYCTALDVVFELIDAGLCSALLPKQIVMDKGDDHNVMACRIEDYRIVRSITLCCSPNLHLHNSPRLMKDLIIGILQEEHD